MILFSSNFLSQEQVLSIRGELAEKEEEFHELQERLSQEVQYLQESLQSLREELTMKNSELSSLTQTAVEQKQNLEVQYTCMYCTLYIIYA